jgi:hypothetical protein
MPTMTTKAFAKKTTTTKVATQTIVKKERTKTADYSKKKVVVPAPFPKYPEYRLADIVSTVEYRNDVIGNKKRLKAYCYEDETLKEYIFRQFPSSIASQYLRKTKRVNDIDVLSNIVDDFVTSTDNLFPADDVMVMHLRVGDVIDRTDLPVEDFLNRRVNSIHGIWGIETLGCSPVYVRCLASFYRALKKTQELGFRKISLVYGFHIVQPIEKSKQYIAALVQYARARGFEVEMITHTDADVSFAYACKAKHFIPGGGGFSKLMAKVVRAKGNSVYHVRV